MNEAKSCENINAFWILSYLDTENVGLAIPCVIDQNLQKSHFRALKPFG